VAEKILAVDDEEDILALTRTVLEDNGYEVVTANSGKGALAKFKKEKFDLILLDILMPDMNGFTVLEKMRKTDKKTKIVFLSVLEVSPIRLQQLKKQGISDYMLKPYDEDDLIKRVKKIIGKKNG